MMRSSYRWQGVNQIKKKATIIQQLIICCRLKGPIQWMKRASSPARYITDGRRRCSANWIVMLHADMQQTCTWHLAFKEMFTCLLSFGCCSKSRINLVPSWWFCSPIANTNKPERELKHFNYSHDNPSEKQTKQTKQVGRIVKLEGKTFSDICLYVQSSNSNKVTFALLPFRVDEIKASYALKSMEAT